MSDDLPWEREHAYEPGEWTELAGERWQICVVCGMSDEHECHAGDGASGDWFEVIANNGRAYVHFHGTATAELEYAEAESLAIALVQATPNTKAEVMLATLDIEVGECYRDNIDVWRGEDERLCVDRATAIAIGLALIRAARAKEAK